MGGGGGGGEREKRKELHDGNAELHLHVHVDYPVVLQSCTQVCFSPWTVPDRRVCSPPALRGGQTSGDGSYLCACVCVVGGVGRASLTVPVISDHVVLLDPQRKDFWYTVCLALCINFCFVYLLLFVEAPGCCTHYQNLL